MKLILIRHGESISNKSKIQLSNNDNILTSEGEEQANLCGKALKLWLGTRDFRLYASTSVRARLTAEIIKNEIDPSIQVKYDIRLIEKRLQESYEECFKRFQNFINDPILNKNVTEEILVIITHGNLIQSVIGNALNLHDCSIIETTNCAVSILSDGRVIGYNMVLHLQRFFR
ncbi:phosphoglycerate mutase family protein [Microcoleus sp. herbarium8]|uniref:phosphoglycerate mutase family protein n=1 Tax=Microcoleus sp. herbarium8 TaxID=3055436 RepID=UPI002FD095A3